MLLNAENFKHTEGDHRVENIAAFDADIDENLARFALRFISAKGLSNEFADALEELQALPADERHAADEVPEP